MSGAATVSKCNQVGDHLACLGLIEPPDDPRAVYFHFWIARLDQKLMGEVSMLELPATVFYGGLQRGGEFLHSVSIHSQQHGIVAEIETGGELNANGAHASPKIGVLRCPLRYRPDTPNLDPSGGWLADCRPYRVENGVVHINEIMLHPSVGVIGQKNVMFDQRAAGGFPTPKHCCGPIFGLHKTCSVLALQPSST